MPIHFIIILWVQYEQETEREHTFKKLQNFISYQSLKTIHLKEKNTNSSRWACKYNYIIITQKIHGITIHISNTDASSMEINLRFIGLLYKKNEVFCKSNNNKRLHKKNFQDLVKLEAFYIVFMAYQVWMKGGSVLGHECIEGNHIKIFSEKQSLQ